MDNKEQLREQIEQMLKENQRLVNIPEIADAVLKLLEPQESKEEELWNIKEIGWKDAIRTIYSVTVNKTGEVLKVGDKICWDWTKCAGINPYITIDEFGEDSEGLYMKVAEASYVYRPKELKEWNLRHYKEEPKVLLTTEDGVAITDPKAIVHQVDDNWNKVWSHACTNPTRAFSTEEERDKYIMYNKPLLCLDDLYRMSSCNYITIDKEPAVQSFVKQKLNK